jgi:hypothetical protein
LTNRQVGSPIGIKVRGGGASLLPGNLDARRRRSHRFEVSAPVSAEQQADPSIVTISFGSGVEKVLTQKNVFTSIAIEIRGDHTKCRRELRFQRQRTSQKMIAAIEQGHRIQSDDIDSIDSARILAQDFYNAGFTEITPIREPSEDPRPGGSQKTSSPNDRLLRRPRIDVGLNNFDGPVGVEISEIRAHRLP